MSNHVTPHPYHTSGAPAKSELSHVIREAAWKGKRLAHEIFEPVRGLPRPTMGTNAKSRESRKWHQGRTEKLAPVCEGTARVVGKNIFNVAGRCLADHTGRNIARHLLDIHNAGAQVYVHLVLEAAITWHGRITTDGEVSHARGWGSLRARGIATLGILYYLLRSRMESGDRSSLQYGWAVRGLPRKTFLHLVTYWDRFANAATRMPSLSGIFGRSREQGTYEGGAVGWHTALVDVGAIHCPRLNHWNVPDWEKGRWKKHPVLGDVRWPFIRIELLVGDGEAPELDFGDVRPHIVVVPVDGAAPPSLDEGGASWIARHASPSVRALLARPPPSAPL